jgi:hypothetical protein
MKKLEEIPKKGIFEVPDGYFDQLPGIIQARVAEKNTETRPYFRYALAYALPVVLLLVLAVIYLTPQKSLSAEELLSSVSSEELVAYLEQSEISLDELLDYADYDEAVVEAIEAEAFTQLPVEAIEDLDIELDNF